MAHLLLQLKAMLLVTVTNIKIINGIVLLIDCHRGINLTNSPICQMFSLGDQQYW